MDYYHKNRHTEQFEMINFFSIFDYCSYFNYQDTDDISDNVDKR